MVQIDLSAHQERVADLSYRIAVQMNLSKKNQKRIYLAGLLHDIGLIPIGEKTKKIDERSKNVHKHAFLGARLLSGIRMLRHISKTVKYHHIPYRFGLGTMYKEERVSVFSHILHTADCISVQIDEEKEKAKQILKICRVIEQNKETVFDPQVADAFLHLSNEKRFLEDINVCPSLCFGKEIFPGDVEIGLSEIEDIAKIISHIVDFRSSFRTNHSTGVAKVASTLASLAGFPPEECRNIRIAGYLHDLGKLAINPELLDKPGVLTPEEFQVVKRHAFFTYDLLKMVKGLSKINSWASLHHEKMNGTGYPFGLKAKDIPLGARIMAVADVFTAVSEDRPYRNGMNRREVLEVFENMVRDGSLCPKTVALLVENIELMSIVLSESLRQAESDYRFFKSDAL